MRLGPSAAVSAVKPTHLRERIDQRLVIIAHIADPPVRHDLRCGTASASNDGGPVGERLSHRQPERLRPQDRKQQGTGMTQELSLRRLVHLPDKVHQRVGQAGADDRLEISSVGRVDFRRNHQAYPRAACDVDGYVWAFLGGNPPEEDDVLPVAWAGPVAIQRETMVDVRRPPGRRYGIPLRVANRHRGHAAGREQLLHVLPIQAPMERRHHWRDDTSVEHGDGELVDM